jgi:Ca2+-binding RTX toxin-like protein
MALYPKNFSFYSVTVSDSGTLTGNFSTLLGSAGSTLVAAGKSDVLEAGSGPATLIAASLAGSSTTLIGNGSSSLSGSRGNDLFQIPFAGDSIGGTAGGNDTLSTPINAIDLTDTLSFGSGITGVGNAVYTGLGGATLTGNGLKGSLIGGKSGGNSLIAGSASQTLVGGSTVGGGVDADTLVGNGRSFLVGGNGNNVYVVNTQGDQIIQPSGNGVSSLRTPLTSVNLTDTLHYGTGILNVKQLVFTNDTLTTGTVSLIGNSLDNTIVGAVNASNVLTAGRGSKASLVAGSANDTLIGNGFSTLNGGAGTNLYYVSGSSSGKSDVIVNVGAGSSVIGVPQGSSPFSYDLTAANNSLLPGGVTRLSYTGAANATLVGNTLSGNTVGDTLTGGSGTNVLFAGTAGSSMTGGNKGNLFADIYSSPTVISTMQGGGGNDTYYVSNLNDLIVEPKGPYGGTDVVWTTLPYFNLAATNVAGGVGVDNLTYFGTGNASLVGNSLNNSLDATASTVPSGGITLNGGGGFDTLLGSTVSPNFFVVSDPKYLGSNFKISGGTSSLGDTLSIAAPSTLTDTIFGSKGFQFVQNVESLLLASSSSATLGAAASSSGVTKVILGSGPDTVNAAGYSLPGLTLDATADTTVGDLLKGSSVAGSAFLFSSPNALQVSTITGGAGTDTLAFVSSATPLTLGDGNFTSLISGMNLLSVPGSSFVTLGGNAQTSGVSTIAAGTGNSTLSALGYTSSLTIDVSAGVTDSDSLVGSSVAGTRFVISSPSVLSGSTIQGGGSIDTLSITTPLVGFNDSIPSSDLSIEVLQIASSSSVTLGSNFQAAGIATVVAGSGPDTINAAGFTRSITLDATADTTNADMLVGSSTAGSSFLFSTKSAVSQSTVTGGSGVDTLQLTAPATLADTDFNPSITQLEVLALNGSSSVTLDAQAASTGIVSILGGNGNSSLTQGAGDTLALTLVGGTGNDLISVASPSLIAADSVSGNGGNDTLLIATVSNSITDSVFSRTSGIGTLRLTSSSAASLAASAQAAGIRSVVLGAGPDTIDATAYSTGVTLDATASSAATLLGSGTAGSTFLFSTASALTASSLKGGTGSDTLSLSGSATLPDSAFSKVSSMDVLVSSGASAITVDNLAAQAGITTIVLGDTLAGSTLSYNSTLTQSANNTLAGPVPVALTVIGGNGNDSVLINNSTLLAADSIFGGSGIDTLALGTAGTLDDSLFGRVSGVEALSLSGISSLSIGSLAAAAGLRTFTTTGNSTLSETSLYSGAATLIGGTGNDLVQLTSRARLLVDSIAGGAGTDTLQFTNASTLSDSDFTRTSGIERLQLTSSSRAVLGAVAQGAGINYVYTGAGSDTINAAGMSSAITLDARANATSSLILTGSGTAPTNFLLSGGNVLGLSTIIGGNGLDTLALSSASTLSDGSFSNLSKMDALSLSGASAVTLSNKAQSAGITSVTFGSTLSSDNSTLTQLANNTLPITATGGAGNDLFNIGNSSLLIADSIAGGAGSDTIALAAASTLNDSFSRIRTVEALSLTGASAVTLNSGAVTAGIVSLIGGNGNSSYLIGGAGPTAATLSGGTGSDLFILSSTAQIGTESINGGLGTDTLAISATGSFNDNFTRIAGIEGLSLTGASAVTLGSAAANAGISSVFGGAGNSTFIQAQNNTLGGGNTPVAVTLAGGTLNDLFSIYGSAYLSGDSIVGGVGADTLYLATASTLTNAFAKVTGVEALSLTGASQVTLGSSGQAAGIATVVGGNATNLIDASAYTTGVTINNGASTVPSGLFGGTAADSIVGGSGIDTLRGYSGAASLNSANDTMRGGSGADLFIMAVAADTNNAYGRGASNTAYVTDFTSGVGGDIVQLHQFGASSADYSTLLSGSNLSIYHTSTQTPANLVTVLTQTGTFAWGSNATFI